MNEYCRWYLRYCHRKKKLVKRSILRMCVCKLKMRKIIDLNFVLHRLGSVIWQIFTSFPLLHWKRYNYFLLFFLGFIVVVEVMNDCIMWGLCTYINNVSCTSKLFELVCVWFCCDKAWFWMNWFCLKVVYVWLHLCKSKLNNEFECMFGFAVTKGWFWVNCSCKIDFG